MMGGNQGVHPMIVMTELVSIFVEKLFHVGVLAVLTHNVGL